MIKSPIYRSRGLYYKIESGELVCIKKHNLKIYSIYAIVILVSDFCGFRQLGSICFKDADYSIACSLYLRK